MQPAKKKVGIFGGTFDPVHLGHIHVAKAALDEIGLDSILFVPSSSPPHKHQVVTSFIHRAQMLELACMQHPAFECSTIESTIPAPSFTVLMLENLFSDKISDVEFFFIMGSDAMLEIQTWKDYEAVLGKVHMIVVKRTGCNETQLAQLFSELEYRQKHDHWYNADNCKMIHVLRAEPPPISSSSIRQSIAANAKPQSELAPEVLLYIEENTLYTNNSTWQP
jgi:nicotinate-nucleotide adenylyltransferase